ncbi:MAG: hypothetical protein EKK53_29005 [Burkholderiales bacterium]|nr:MAG: hypothetical protein EKK53_29005 [Burkholderiales bacterium]
MPAPILALASSDRCDRCNRLSVLYFPFSETTPRADGLRHQPGRTPGIRGAGALRRAEGRPRRRGPRPQGTAGKGPGRSSLGPIRG